MNWDGELREETYWRIDGRGADVRVCPAPGGCKVHVDFPGGSAWFRLDDENIHQFNAAVFQAFRHLGKFDPDHRTECGLCQPEPEGRGPGLVEGNDDRGG